ncbi:hypothetical protein [Kocuria kalidii]|uniref:hypothetical protein n=1 Tax=Kocuria kalidii TaxID=3376283 RepID=UPI003787AC1F
MKMLTTDFAPSVGALVMLVSLVGMVYSLIAGEVVGPVAGGGVTLGVILMGWGAFNSFHVPEVSDMQLGQAVERIRLAQRS